MILLLAGCVSDSKYNALEKRVSYLEEQMGTRYSDTDAQNDDISESSNSGTSENIVSEDEEHEDVTKTGSYSYIIDALSDADVVNECKFYFENIPVQGESYDDYYASFKAIPVNTYNDYGVECQFYDNSISREQTNHDVITSIRIWGTQTEMDGSIGYSNNCYGVCVTMIIQDYSRASNIYGQLFDIVSASGKFTELNDVRDSTRWNANAMFWTSDSGAMGVDLMTMEKQDNGYNLSATYYVRRP